MSIDFPSGGWGRQGWVCPKCGHVYSPSTPECWTCNAPSTTITSTDAIPLDFNEIKKPKSFSFGVTIDKDGLYEILTPKQGDKVTITISDKKHNAGKIRRRYYNGYR